MRSHPTGVFSTMSFSSTRSETQMDGKPQASRQLTIIIGELLETSDGFPSKWGITPMKNNGTHLFPTKLTDQKNICDYCPSNQTYSESPSKEPAVLVGHPAKLVRYVRIFFPLTLERALGASATNKKHAC